MVFIIVMSSTTLPSHDSIEKTNGNSTNSTRTNPASFGTEEKCAMGGKHIFTKITYNKIATSIFLNINQRNKLFWLLETK